MSHTRTRLLRAVCAGLLVALLAVLAACRQQGKRETPLPKDVEPNDVVDVDFADDPADPLGPLDGAEITKAFLARRAESARERRAREEKVSKSLGRPYRQREYNVLVVSGGGIFGAYCAGVLCGWSAACKSPEQGGRPVFDVVTGVSIGAMIAPFAFVGQEYDEQLTQLFTTLGGKDIFTIRRSVRSFFAESLADNAPLAARLEQVIDATMIAKIADGHAAGRRLYMGTTNLDTKRLVVWDIGAIAAKGGPGAGPLIRKVMLASAAIPGFFPSVRFDVTIDGKPYQEMHVDGGVTRSMFFRPPHFPPSEPEPVGPNSLAGSNVFALVAGKAYPDPEGVRARTVAVVGASVSNLLYVTTRNDLFRFYTYCMLSGMDFFVSAIPADLEVTNSSTNFDPAEARKMFAEGFRLAKEGAYTKAQKADPLATGSPTPPGSGAKPAVEPDPKGDPDPKAKVDGKDDPKAKSDGKADNKPRNFTYPDGSPILFKEPGPAWRTTPPGVAAGERGKNRAGLRLVVKQPPSEPNRPQGTDQNVGGAPPVAK